jgi:hypothetical protein
MEAGRTYSGEDDAFSFRTPAFPSDTSYTSLTRRSEASALSFDRDAFEGDTASDLRLAGRPRQGPFGGGPVPLSVSVITTQA